MDSYDSKGKLEDLIETFVRLTEEATAHRLAERQAAIVIQCAWRRKLVSFKLRKWTKAANDIQRVYRGHLGRVKFLHKQIEVARDFRMAYFNKKATYIQKIYQGYWSRKYVHSYYDRKQFIESSMDLGKRVRQDVECYGLDMKHEEQDNVANVVGSSIAKFWLTNHHLISTASRSSIFYSPYIAVLKGLNDIEDRIRDTCREEARRRREEEEGGGGGGGGDVWWVQQEAARRRRQMLKQGWVVRVSEFVTTEGPWGPSMLERRRAEEKAGALLEVGGAARFRSVVRPPRRAPSEDASTRTSTEWRRKEILRALAKRKSRHLYLRVSPKPFFIPRPMHRPFSCGPLPPLAS